MHAKLWNRNFTLAFIGMIFSAMGGVGLNIAMSVVVFQETQSTTLSAVFTALSMIPHLVLPLVAGAFIDRRSPLKVLVGNEILLAGLFFITAAVTAFFGFSYVLYLVFSLLISCFGVISQLSADSIIPQIMPREQYTRGNAILNVIYPLCSVLIAPVAMLLFERFGMPVILACYGALSLVDAALESRIDTKFEYIQAEKTDLRAYANDLKSAFAYFREDRAVRSVFLMFAFAMFAESASTVLMYPFFNQSEVLTNTQYALMNSIRSAGYMLGGFLHYFIKIPDKWRYTIAVIVYMIFVLLDAPMFLMSFGLLCATRFFLGILGMNSANIRVSAIQARVKNEQRAKLNALYTVLVAISTIVGQFLAGALGEFLPYWSIQMAFQGVYLLGILIFVLPKRNGIRELYNFSTAPAQK